MKDEHDYFAGELVELAPAKGAAADSVAGGRSDQRGKHRRMPNQSCATPPAGAKPSWKGQLLGFGQSVLPVSAVARDWGVSTRRVRTLLVAGRLDGRQLENGYWEVYYPYGFIEGTRGPILKRQQRQPDKLKAKKPEHSPEY